VSWQDALTLGIPVVIALLSLVGAYLNGVRLSLDKERLDRVNRQLADLYGPLLALVSSANRSWDEFRRQYRPGGGFWGSTPPPTEAEAEAWRLWMTTVFMPLNRQMRDLVVAHADLLREEAIDPCLLDVCAHVASYEAILKRWEHGDFSENKPPLPFPRDALRAYAESGFRDLKRDQDKALRARRIAPWRKHYGWS
jgi:hypothetical protein